MIHIFPYWDWNPGQLIDVRVCSNAPFIALYCNGRLISTKHIDHNRGSAQTGTWKIPYGRGELVALAYDESGRCIARASRRSFGDPARIKLIPSKSYLEADGRDLVFVSISVEDVEGNRVEHAANRMEVAVEGAGRLRGLDNGDSTDYDSYKGISRRLFNGKLMAIVGSTFETGAVTITVRSLALPEAKLTLPAVPSAREDLRCYSVYAFNSPRQIHTGKAEEVPLRKIELRLLSGAQELCPEDSPEARLEALLYPVNAAYRDIAWSVVTASGIETPLAWIETAGTQAVIHPRGDGEFRIRCTSTNGTDTVRLISQIEFTSHGFGKLHKDPYSFVSAGLYDDSNGNIGPGNEQGIATARDGTAIFGFTDLDFGCHGSDTIHLPIFALTDDTYHIELWQGRPGNQGSQLLDTLVYQKKSIWNVYQEETYRLNTPLRGTQSLYFVTWAKLHIKGFRFEKQNRTFRKILSLEYDELYGDQYRLAGDAIKEIGNNVTVTFKDLDFKGTEPLTVKILGRSLTDRNSIHIKFKNKEAEQVVLVDFEHSEDVTQNRYPLPAIHKDLLAGSLAVSFVFLPGSAFDFVSFQFE